MLKYGVAPEAYKDDEGVKWLYNLTKVTMMDEDTLIASKKTAHSPIRDDNLLFHFKPTRDGCTVDCTSKSKARGRFDGGASYCNLWNVVSRLDGLDSIQKHECSDEKLTVPEKTCERKLRIE